MKRFLALCLCLLPVCGFANDQPSSISLPTFKADPIPALQVSLTIEPLTEEQLDASLTIGDISEAITEQLGASAITIHDNPQLPILSLRIRTIHVGPDLASYFQLCLLEPAMLIRNRSIFNAITWAQASLLSCPPQNFKKEALETISSMAHTFGREFLNALQQPA
jgi:outer membrane lipopolysaccharide assembly protein LptE/RlpB